MSAIAIPMRPGKGPDSSCEIVIFTTGLPEMILINKFRSLSNEKQSSVGHYLLTNSNIERREFTFFCPFHARFCRPTDQQEEARFVDALPQCTLWTVGNRVVMLRRTVDPKQVGWLRERKLSLAIAAPFIRIIRKWEKELVWKPDKTKGWRHIFPPKKRAKNKFLRKRVVVVRTKNPTKIRAFVEHLRKRFVKMQWQSLESRLQRLNEMDKKIRRKKGTDNREKNNPLF